MDKDNERRDALITKEQILQYQAMNVQANGTKELLEELNEGEAYE